MLDADEATGPMEKEGKLKWGLNVPEKTSTSNANTSEKPLLSGAKDQKTLADEPDRESYAAMPVEDFGAAMLRSMSTKTTNKKNESKPIQYVPRPVGLGLGSSQVTDLSQLKQRKPIELALGLDLTPEEQESLQRSKKKSSNELLSRHANYVGIDERAPKRIKMVIEVGSKVFITGGEHADLMGTVVQASSKESFWVVELGVNRELVLVHKDDLKLAAFASKTDLSAKESLGKQEKRSWLYPGLRVKIVSKNSFHSGKYYNVKGVILDVHGRDECSLRLASSNVLQNVPQWALQTCIPRQADPIRATVRLLKAGDEHFHAPFRVLQLDDDKSQAVIQLDDDPSVIMAVEYDDICEFVEMF